MWSWTCQRLAMILRADWRRIPMDWLIRLGFQLWPPKRRRVVLWILANFVAFRLKEGRTQSLLDYYDFLRRTRWTLEQIGSHSRNVGNYLSVITLDTRRWVKLRFRTSLGAHLRCLNRHDMRVNNLPNNVQGVPPRTVSEQNQTSVGFHNH
jgi:hypothetical protein